MYNPYRERKKREEFKEKKEPFFFLAVSKLTPGEGRERLKYFC